jgi:hypothetical protein
VRSRSERERRSQLYQIYNNILLFTRLNNTSVSVPEEVRFTSGFVAEITAENNKVLLPQFAKPVMLTVRKCVQRHLTRPYLRINCFLKEDKLAKNVPL